MPFTPLTPEQLAAKRAELEAREVAALQALGAAASHLANMRRMKLKPMNQNLLWAEWEFAKALKEWDGDGLFDEMFSEACDNLGVDEEGEDVPDFTGGQMTARDRDLDYGAAA